MYTEEQYFTVTRESIGLEPLVKRVEQNNSIHKIKNCGLRLKECQKFLELADYQVKNAVRVNILKSVVISDTLYICIQSALQVNNIQALKEKIFDEDELTTNIAAKLLEISTKSVRRLIEEGYLTVTGKYDFKYGEANLVKKGEVRSLKPQIPEIKEFWKAQAKINRQLGAQKAAKKRKNVFNNEKLFKDEFFTKFENVPYKQAKLVKICFSLLSLNYYIERKLDRNIVDQELLNLYSAGLKKLIELYKNSECLEIYFVEGEGYINYCPDCLKSLNSLNKNDYSDNYFKEPCKDCIIDDNHYSILFFYVRVLGHRFVLHKLFREVKDWFCPDSIPHQRISLMELEEMNNRNLENVHFNKNQLRSFKLFEIISYLNEFIDSKDPDFNLNL